MKKISLWVSFLSAALMISGFVMLFLDGHLFSLPGIPALPIGRLISWSSKSPDITFMSLGIVLLGLLPVARLLLAGGIYFLSRDLKNMIIGLIVLLELLLSLSLSL